MATDIGYDGHAIAGNWDGFVLLDWSSLREASCSLQKTEGDSINFRLKSVLRMNNARTDIAVRGESVSLRVNIDRPAIEQEITLRALFENTTAGIAEIDAATGRFLTVNRRYCQIAGRSEAELLNGLSITDVLHPDDDRLATSVAEARGDAERRYLRPDGQIAWVRISVAVTARDHSGEAKRISAVIQDVTESHAAQESLRASEALLRLSLEIGQIGCFRRDLVTGQIQCGTRNTGHAWFPTW